MTTYVCRYPDGAPGFALLCLRCGLAVVGVGIAMVLSPDALDAALPCAAAGGIALLLAIGLATRAVALLLGAAAAVALAMPGGTAQALLLAGQVGACVALALAGPGAFSIDARRHGRRVIHLQASSRQAGTPDRGGGD